jgi:hypothetical protein
MAKQKPTIHDLVIGGIVKVGQGFFARDYKGTIVSSERVKIEYAKDDLDPKNIGNRSYKSFSEPANQICGYPVNAWFFWSYLKGKEIEKSEKRPIDDWRREWRDKMNKIEVVYVCMVCGRETPFRNEEEPPNCKYCGGETEKVTIVEE